MRNLRYRKMQLWIGVASIRLLIFAAHAQAQLPVVKLIATGGTIAMKIDPVKKAPVPAISGEDLIAAVPEIAKVAKIEVLNLSNVPSDYMDPPRWIELQKAVIEAFARPEVAGVIVSHGTDTLEETAYFLDLTVPNEKPIVLIGAQRNASERDFDGPGNLLNAARICVSRIKMIASDWPSTVTSVYFPDYGARVVPCVPPLSKF
jgi:L-asparaginase